ncbi:MAG TPA: hypothetical protein VGF75_07365 [Candidatus Saccharimonadales bacterium]|jgi:hypothetical protein
MSDDNQNELPQTLSTELEAVGAGQDFLRNELTEFLGASSFVANAIEREQQDVEAGHRNLEFIQRFAGLLPSAGDKTVNSGTEGTFCLSGEDQQYIARQIQASAIWVPTKYSAHEYEPLFIIGRKQSVNEGMVALLLLGSKDLSPESGFGPPRSYKPEVVTVSEVDMKSYDEVASAVSGSEFTENDVTSLVSQATGKLVIKYDSPGSIRLSNWQERDSSDQDAIKQLGVRSLKGPIPITVGISTEDIDAYTVPTYIATLAKTFKFEDKLQELMKTGVVEVKVDDHTTIENLRGQNKQLRQALKESLLAGGILDESTLEEALSKKFPKI